MLSNAGTPPQDPAGGSLQHSQTPYSWRRGGEGYRLCVMSRQQMTLATPLTIFLTYIDFCALILTNRWLLESYHFLPEGFHNLSNLLIHKFSIKQKSSTATKQATNRSKSKKKLSRKPSALTWRYQRRFNKRNCRFCIIGFLVIFLCIVAPPVGTRSWRIY